ncbi:helix-turn-helix domain-containing protein [Salmonella enterica]|nr:helix-turn-helix domain-containing protein [Salmonella enterica]
MKIERSGILRHTVLTLLRWVEKKLHHNIRAAELSAVAGYCIRHLGNGFIQVTNMSLGRYIRLRKLTQAANLLRLTRRPITDIALTYAFGSLQAFSRAFRQHFGMSPKSYREAEVCPQGLLIPPPVRNNYQYTARQCNHTGFWLQPYAQQKIKVPLNLHMTLSEQGNLREDLYTLFYNHLFRNNSLETFTIIADIIKKNMGMTCGYKPPQAHTPGLKPWEQCISRPLTGSVLNLAVL